MLKKLIKHEFRATGRITWPVFLGLLALTVVMRVSLHMFYNNDGSKLLVIIASLLLITYIVALAALVLAPLVLSAVRWRDHVLRDEGYLTLTLPVSVHELLASKLIVSAVWYAAAFAVGLLSLSIATAGLNGAFESYRIGYSFPSIFELFDLLFKALGDYDLVGDAVLILFELLGNFIFAVSAAALVVYAAYSIGYSFNRHRTLWTVLLVFVFYQVAQFTAINMINQFSCWDAAYTMSTPQLVELFLLWGMFGELIFCAAGYAATWYFTTKRLNLE